MRALMASLALIAFAAGPAKADREVTDIERAKLVAAVTAQGCTGGKLKWDNDDREFEVDEAVCNDGRKYDLKFNAEYALTSKKFDH